jgi:hypothetical protein
VSVSLYDIDHAATQRRIEAAAAGGLRALGETARRSEEIDQQVRDMIERRQREKQAMDERIAAAKPEPEQPPEQARPRPATLRLGAPEDRQAASPLPKRRPKSSKPPGDDDLSGRTWLR